MLEGNLLGEFGGTKVSYIKHDYWGKVSPSMRNGKSSISLQLGVWAWPEPVIEVGPIDWTIQLDKLSVMVPPEPEGIVIPQVDAVAVQDTPPKGKIELTFIELE